MWLLVTMLVAYLRYTYVVFVLFCFSCFAIVLHLVCTSTVLWWIKVGQYTRMLGDDSETERKVAVKTIGTRGRSTSGHGHWSAQSPVRPARTCCWRTVTKSVTDGRHVTDATRRRRLLLRTAAASLHQFHLRSCYASPLCPFNTVIYPDFHMRLRYRQWRNYTCSRLWYGNSPVQISPSDIPLACVFCL